MKPYFKTKITNSAGAEWFLTAMYADDLLYHPEDDAADIITACPCPSEGGPTIYAPLFSSEEAKILNERMNEVWVHLDDPCEFVCDHLL